MGYDLSLREQALKLYLEGTSLRAIGRLLSVNHQSIANWINDYAGQLPSKVADDTPTDTVETDELFTFVGKKTRSLCSSVGSPQQPPNSGSRGGNSPRLGDDAGVC
jgi:hypothetical protein